MSIRDKPDQSVADQTMYSCGSVAPKTFKRRPRVDASGCTLCSSNRPHQLWEASEGGAHLVAELAALAADAGIQPAGPWGR